MIRIVPVTRIDDRTHIAILDTSSISFMQKLQEKGVRIDHILKDYELILIPQWVLIEIEDAEGRAAFVQYLIDAALDRVSDYRKDMRKITYSREQSDHSVVLVTEAVDNNTFMELIQDESVHIIF